MILLAALAGAAVAAGIVLFLRELARRQPPPGRPPRLRILGRGDDHAVRRRILYSVPAALIVLAITRWPVAAVVTAVAVIFLPKLTFVSGQRKRTGMLEGLEQWIRRLADLLTASRGLEDAIEVSARSAPEAISAPVMALASRLSSGAGTEAAIRAFADDIDDPAGDRIAAALLIATSRRGGGGSRDVLSALAVMLSRDVAARREIEAERAQHRTTVQWITIFVVGFTVFAVLNRGYSAPYGTVVGQVVLAAVAVLYSAGLAWLNHLGTIPAPGRFLDAPPARTPADDLVSTGRRP
jgi:Flp pilus assembly protein TadB